MDMIFGAAYYPEYMPEGREIKTDLQMMKAAGMNTIRVAESTWSTWEKREGIFDFTWLDKILQEAARMDMQVIIGTPTYAIPAWLVKKDPSVMVTTAQGQAFYGHRQLMDITNPTYLFHAERIIRKLLERSAKHPNVIGFQIDNETKHYGVASEMVQKRFVEHLKKRFGTVEELNKAYYLAYWSNAVGKWDDFPDMRGCVNAGLASEFSAFQRSLVTEFLSWQSEIVKEYKRDDQFITHNLDFEWKKFGADIAQDGYSYGVQPDVDHVEVAKTLTIAGTDIYHPTQDELTGAEIAYCGDSIRSLKHQNYLVLETEAQAFKYWTPYPGQLRQQAYSHLASGADGVMYWNWHSIHNGYETYWKGLLSHDLASNPACEEAAVFGKELQRCGEKLQHMKKNNRTALVVDVRSLEAFRWFPIDRDLSYNDVVRWMYDSLYEMNIECDIVDASALHTEDYKMIVTPALYSVTEETVQKLDAFVKRGGVLVSSFKSFVADENLSVYPDRQPHFLNKCFGMHYDQFTRTGKTKICGTKLRYFAELLNVDTASVLASYEHRYWSAYAGITCNEYGLGKAYYIGCFTEKELLKTVLKKAALEAEVQPEHDMTWPVIVRNGISKEGTKLHYIFHYSEENAEVVCPYASCKNILTGNSYIKGDKLKLHDWDVVILEEKE